MILAKITVDIIVCSSRNIPIDIGVFINQINLEINIIILIKNIFIPTSILI